MKNLVKYIPSLILMIITVLVVMSIDASSSYLCATTFGAVLWNAGEDNQQLH